VPAATSLCEPLREFIEAQLRLKRNATAIFQDLVDQHGFAGQYNSVKRFCAKLRHKEPEQFDRLSFLPGEEMQVDYGEGAPTRMPGSERYRKPRLFVATLRYSRASLRRVVWKSSQQIWAELHERALRYFGGCPQYVVLDNLKEGILKPDLYEPDLNPVYAAALKGRRFESIEAQNEFLAHWEKNWAAKRIHGTERRQVQAMFEEERTHLKALPLLGMQYFNEAVRTVCDDSCVRVDHSSYAARPAAIGSKVLVRIYAQRIEIGEHASRLCELLFAIEGRVGQRKLWGIVGLVRRYPAHCVDAACAQALEQGVYSYKRVLALAEVIFAQALAAIETESTGASSSASAAGVRTLTQQHELIRDADEYADLFAHAAALTATATATATSTLESATANATTTNNITNAPGVQA